MNAYASAGWRKFLPVLLIAAGFWAYRNSFGGAFVFDDFPTIVENARLRHLWPLHALLSDTIRPVTDITFALNHALGKLHARGYHAANLAMHLLAALALFGVVRRTLLSVRLRARYAAAAPWLALCISVLWAVHPLQTQSVTYITQRAEVLMGLFYLLTLYCVIRGTEDVKGSLGWTAAAIASCALGMGSKGIMATAPLMVLFYDRIFLSGSFRESLERRKGLYAGLAVTWAIPVALLFNVAGLAQKGAGFGLAGISPVEYASIQPGVILHYLRLCFWPRGLSLDYDWPVPAQHAVIIAGLVMAGLLALTAWALRRRPPWGFLGLWFFLILVPTSSIFPVADHAAEQRMYLPLAAVIALAVFGADRLLRALMPSHDVFRRGIAAALVIATAASLTALTLRRNDDYRSEFKLWSDVLAKQPGNARAHCNMGSLLAEQGRMDDAAAHFREAIRLKPSYVESHYNLGRILFAQGNREEALRTFHRAVQIRPEDAHARYLLGLALAQGGRLAEARDQLEESLRLRPEYAPAHNDLGTVLTAQGRLEEALAHFREAGRLNSHFAEAYSNAGSILARQGKLDEALAYFARALEFHPGFTQARMGVANILVLQGKPEEARVQFAAALGVKPDGGEVYYCMGAALENQGKAEAAAAEYRKALERKPNYAQAHNNLGGILAGQGKVEEAIENFEQALWIEPDFAQAKENLSKVLKARGSRPEEKPQ